MIGRRPVFEPAKWSDKATFIGKVEEECRCTACHRRIMRGFRFVEDLEDGAAFTFGYSCLRRRTDPKLREEAPKEELEGRQ